MTPAETARIRRILYALDAATDAPETLETALDLAQRLHAELIGLFVEDVNLLRSAAFPFVRQFQPGASAWQELNTEATERELQARAQRARRHLEDSARNRQVAFSFRVTRGEVGQAVAQAAEDVDLVVLAGRTRPVVGQVRLGSSARAAARQSLRPVLVLREGRLSFRHVLVAYDASPQAGKALALAASLARAAHGEVTVLMLTGTVAEVGSLEETARETLKAYGVPARFEAVGEPTLIDLCGLARRVRDAVLIVGGDSPFAQGAAADELIERITCPLVIVR